MEAVTLYTTFHEEKETYSDFLRRIGLIESKPKPKIDTAKQLKTLTVMLGGDIK